LTTDTRWSRPFDDAITLPDGRTLVTLGDAGRYIADLPSKVQHRPEWQAAAQALLLVAERGGLSMLARIGIMRALNSGKPDPEITPRRKRAKAYKMIRR
jgi:hypothetical protein